MKVWLHILAVVVGIVVVYAAASNVLGYSPIALAINFGRVALAVAVLVMYVPLTLQMFQTHPVPRRDFLVAGILCSWGSAICFAVMNELGNQLGVNTSVFTNPVSGFFSLMLVAGGIFHVVAPDVAHPRRKWMAIGAGVLAGAIFTVFRVYRFFQPA